MGGPGIEVVVDFMKLFIRDNKAGRNVEWLVLGFMERNKSIIGGRCRAYVVPNIKMQTIAMYMSKTVANKSIVYTPFYQQTGWEFLDKYFDHRRLSTRTNNTYFGEKE